MKTARILVLRGGALGDFIVTLPALQALRERWPRGYIELIGYPHVARLAETAGIVDKVESLDRAGIARLFALKFVLSEEQIGFFRSFDIIINYLHDPDGSVAENLRQTGAGTILHHDPLVTGIHACDHFAKPLEQLAIYAAGRSPVLRIIGERPSSPFIAMHPGSGSVKKNWPAEKFIALARALQSGAAAGAGARPAVPADARVVFILGEADDVARGVLGREMPEAEVWRQLPLPELASRLAGASLYLGNDSGISHLAAALGVRGLALFGPSDPAVWQPRGPRVQVLRAPEGELDRLETDEVLAAIRGLP